MNAPPTKKSFHAANSEKSRRLQKVLRTMRFHLKDGLTTIQISYLANTPRPTSDISELRANGYEFESRYEGMKDGCKVTRFWLLGRDKEK